MLDYLPPRSASARCFRVWSSADNYPLVIRAASSQRPSRGKASRISTGSSACAPKPSDRCALKKQHLGPVLLRDLRARASRSLQSECRGPVTSRHSRPLEILPTAFRLTRPPHGVRVTSVRMLYRVPRRGETVPVRCLDQVSLGDLRPRGLITVQRPAWFPRRVVIAVVEPRECICQYKCRRPIGRILWDLRHR